MTGPANPMRLASALFAFSFASASLADGIPATDPLSYSGVLLNSVGAPVTSTVSARLSLWDDQTATLSASRKCETSVPALTPDSAGRFRITLEAACLGVVKANPNLWVQVEIGTTALPRSKLGAVPYAVEADRATTAATATTAQSASGALAQQVVPPGAVMAFDLAACPAGWTPLASAAGRTIVGVNAGSNGLSARALGATVGEERHTMTVAEMVSHDHPLVLNAHTPSGCGLWTINWNPGALANCSNTTSPPLLGGGLQNGMTILPNGSGTPFNVMQPSVVLLYCKKS
jgi:hypothetical protein